MRSTSWFVVMVCAFGIAPIGCQNENGSKVNENTSKTEASTAKAERKAAEELAAKATAERKAAEELAAKATAERKAAEELAAKAAADRKIAEASGAKALPSQDSSGGVMGHPEITEGLIERTIIGKKVGGGYGGWTFESHEPRKIKIIEQKKKEDGDKVSVVVDMKTSARGPMSVKRRRGRLRLSYEWVAGEWVIMKIDNLTFKGK